MDEEQDEGRQPGVYYPDDVEKGINMDKTLGIRDVSIVEELAWWFLPGIIAVLLGIATIGVVFWDIVDLISLGL